MLKAQKLHQQNIGLLHIQHGQKVAALNLIFYIKVNWHLTSAAAKMASYELVNKSDWLQENINRGVYERYDMETLDSDWYPVLCDHLRCGPGHSEDAIDGSYIVRNPQMMGLQTQLSDQIDGRGRFSAKELEQELRAMPRSVLVKTNLSHIFKTETL